MSADLESTLLSVWQQTLIGKKKSVELDGVTYPVRQTAKSKLKQVDFRFEERELRGLEQNPGTKSRWAKMAREGGQVMQFLERGKYVGGGGRWESACLSVGAGSGRARYS